MKRLLVRIVMIALWTIGIGISMHSVPTGKLDNSALVWSVPMAVVGIGYFLVNAYRLQKLHNAGK